jgi:hypothetical protein
MNEDTRLPNSKATEDDLVTANVAAQMLGKYRAWVERRFEADAWMRMESGSRRPLFRASKIEAAGGDR